MDTHPSPADERACNSYTCVNFISMHLSLYRIVNLIFERAKRARSLFLSTGERERKRLCVFALVIRLSDDLRDGHQLASQSFS